jgi:hypothetical protein
MRLNRPQGFPGTEEEKAANRLTHNFDYSDPGDARCFNCDCRPGGIIAQWPCGQEPPREVIE